MTSLRIATRRSELALAQARRVAELVTAAGIGEAELVEIDTPGDLDRHSPITQLTELGAFVRSVQQAVLDGTADLAVHSLKDLPVDPAHPSLVCSFPERRSALDVMVGGSLETLPLGGTVGTGSPRREEQLRMLRPDATVVPLRGNVDTRLRKVAAGDPVAALLAEAGLERLGRTDVISQRLTVEQMVPAPGQGALAVEAVAGTRGAEVVAAALDSSDLRPLLSAERQLLAETGAGCRSALGAVAAWESGRIRLDCFVSDERGRRRSVVVGDSPDEVVAFARQELGL